MNQQVSALATEEGPPDQQNEKENLHQRSHSLVNINNLIKSNERASDPMIIQERDESNDSKGIFLTSFIQENPINSSVSIRQTVINESNLFPSGNQNSKSSMDKMDPKARASAQIGFNPGNSRSNHQSQSTRRQAANRGRKADSHMAYTSGRQTAGMANTKQQQQQITAHASRIQSNPNLVMATLSNLKKADGTTGKVIGHRSRNTSACKTNSVHSLRMKKANGLSGELYGFNTMQDVGNQAATADPMDLQARLN